VSPLGAYGIRLEGLEAAAELLVPVADDTPLYRVESAVGRPEPGPEHVDDDGAVLRLRSGGRVLIDRHAGRARFEVPHPVRPDELVHPYLAPAAAVIGRWLGRESVHAGAIAVDGRALGIVGVRGAGKSSTLAGWALDGGEVLCDDLLVLDGRTTFVGPRSIDLREDAAAQLGAGEAIGVTGARERWRLRLAPIGNHHDLVGCAVETVGGAAIGTVIAVEESSGPSRLVVNGTDGEVLIPLVVEICRAIDIGAKRIVVAPPEGLLELNSSTQS